MLVGVNSPRETKMKSTYVVVLLATLLVAVDAILLEVPGYATIEGSTDNSFHTNRQYFKFRGLNYAEKPTSLNRFLVIILHD